jgi:hypothetical protein
MQINPSLLRRSEIDAVSPLQLSVRSKKKIIRSVWMACARNVILKTTRFIIQVGLRDGLQIDEYEISYVKIAFFHEIA